MATVKFTVEAAAALADSISDYLVGVHEAAVEFGANHEGNTIRMSAFISLEPASVKQCTDLCRRIASDVAGIASVFKEDEPTVGYEIVAERDWSSQWKEHFRPFEIIDGVMVAPSWEPCPEQGGRLVLIIDPGMAFGTGHHATTRLCLGLLRTAITRHGEDCRVLDVGTGSGILAIAAAKFGAGRVLGIDNDPEAVRAALANKAENKVGERVAITAEPLERLSGRYGVIVANIVHDVLVAMADDLSRLSESGGTLILSGLLHGEQTRSIGACYEERGFRVLRSEREGEWAALLLKNERRRAAAGREDA